MRENRYILEPYNGINTRYRCPSPSCGKGRTFARYIDIHTGKHLHASVGRCNRENNCGYHYTPKQYFHENNISDDSPHPQSSRPKPVTPALEATSFIPIDVFKANLCNHEQNRFAIFLINKFGIEIAQRVIGQYFIGSSDHWAGSTIFWQIDTEGKIRTGKIMLYDQMTGRRVKEPFSHVGWIHKSYRLDDFSLKQCFFGEHLLQDKTKPVAIVESEKTAIIASIYLPKFIWIASGSLANLNADKCTVLRNRNVILFPDLKGYCKWEQVMKSVSHIGLFVISDLLEFKATNEEREQGFDIADYLLKFDLKDFTSPRVVFDNNSGQTKTIDSPGEAENYSREPFKGLDHLYTCPSCKSPKMFVRYIDIVTGKYFGENVGRCNREILCGYDLKPGSACSQN